MTKDELYKMAQTISRDVFSRNKDVICEQVRDALVGDEKKKNSSTDEVIASAIAICLSLAPEISAVVTAKMLVELGLVSVECAE